MKRITICITAALAATLAVGAMAGCSSQSASSASASAESSASASAASVESAAASEAAAESSAAESSAAESSAAESASAEASAESSQDPVIVELKELIANPPTYKSVTLTETTESTFSGDAEEASSASAEASDAEEASSASAEASDAEEASSASAAASDASAEDASLASLSIYKFDESGDKVRTSATYELDDIKLQYYTEGNDAVVVTDGPSYSGTVEQLGCTSHAAGVKSYLEETLGDLNTIIDCAATATKQQEGDVTTYTLELDPEKYIASDEILTIAAEVGAPVTAATYVFGIDKDGRIVKAVQTTDDTISSTQKTIVLSDFDSTVVEEMPKADRTYEEMDVDIQMKMDAFAKQLDATAQAEDEAASSGSAA